MLSALYNFQEQQTSRTTLIQIKGIQREYFEAILHWINTDTLKFNQPYSLCVWVHFLIYADYFMLESLVERCSDKIAHYIKVKNVVPIYLIA